MSRANIWHQNETQGYDKGKVNTSFSKWRVLVMERTAQLANCEETSAAIKMHEYGKYQLGLDYDNGVTAEDLAAKLAA